MTEIDMEAMSTSASPAAPVTAGTQTRRRLFVDHRFGAVACVFAGGTLGTAAREALGLAFPSGTLPYTTWIINIGGALVLGFLTGALTGGTSGFHRGLRLAAGTGLCGGFTTYSTLAVQTATLFADGHAPSGLLYAFGTLFVGAATAWLGLILGLAAVRRRAPGARVATPGAESR